MSTYAKTHAKAGITALSVAVFGAFALLSPLSVQAWPFNAAHAAATDAPVLHDSSTLQLLAAALNLNPDPNQGDTGPILTDGSALMAASGPDGSASADSAESSSDVSGTGDISVYTVKDGDSISGIASQFNVSVNTILWANDLTIHSTIKPGMTLDILPVSGVTHTVQKGETLNSIAAKYGASASEIATFNGLDTNATVVVGDSLIIPGGEEEVAPAPAAKTATTKTTTKTSTSKSTSKTTVRSDLGTAAGGGYFRNPVPGAILTQGIHGKNAVDLAAPAGTPIHAAAAGTVIISKADGAWNGGYGSYVVVSHANGTQTLYAHMSKNISTVGEKVSQGEVLGYVGETGEATGNHVHFEVRGATNPFGYSCTLNRPCY